MSEAEIQAKKAAVIYRRVADVLSPGEPGGRVVLARNDLINALVKAYQDGFETGVLCAETVSGEAGEKS